MRVVYMMTVVLRPHPTLTSHNCNNVTGNSRWLSRKFPEVRRYYNQSYIFMRNYKSKKWYILCRLVLAFMGKTLLPNFGNYWKLFATFSLRLYRGEGNFSLPAFFLNQCVNRVFSWNCHKWLLLVLLPPHKPFWCKSISSGAQYVILHIKIGWREVKTSHFGLGKMAS